MILDESIELINKKKNINEMNNLSNLTVSEMRDCMHEMMADESKSGCLYEVLTHEGFLPETLAEGEDYGTHCETMMEDDMIAEEMYKACAMNESECGYKVQEWLNEKLVGGQKELDKNNNGKIDAGDFAMLRKKDGVEEYDKSTMMSFTDQYGKEKGKSVYYATANKQDRNPETFEKNEGLEEGENEGSRYMFFSNLELIKHHIEEMMGMDKSAIEGILENGHDWAADHIATAKESIDQVFDFLTGEANDDNKPEQPMMEVSDDDMDDDDMDSPTYLLNKKRVLDQEIAKFSKYVDSFIPMVAKLEPSTMNQYFNAELRSSGEYSNEAFQDFLTKKEDESSVDYYTRLTTPGSGYSDIFSGLVEPRKRGYFAKYGNKMNPELLDNMEDVLSDIFDMKNGIYTKKADIDKIEASIEDKNADGDIDTDFDSGKIEKNVDAIVKADELGLYDDELDEEKQLDEVNLPAFKPIVGKNVQSTNKSDSNSTNKEGLEDAEDSQETTEEKVDNLKNQKFAGNPNMESEFEEEIREKKQLGAFNSLNLDFQNGVPKSYKDRVEMEVTTGHSRKRDEANLGKEANVDHESTKRTGEKIIAASKTNQGERDDFYKANPILSTDKEYERSSLTGKDKGGKKNPGGGDLNESELAEIEKIKSMFGYEQKLVNENKKPKELNEDEILFKNISSKKFI